jgi:class 3 adenylate cyclase
MLMGAKQNVEAARVATLPAGRDQPTPAELEAELAEARAEIARLNEELADLQLLSQATMEHGEAIEDELAEKNRTLEQLSRKLSKYLSPQVYNSIFTGRQSVEISSTRKKLTIFFSDIADFTSTTESLESEELTALLNHYLTEMSRIALEHGATIDKYIGDAIVAFFGDPESRGARGDALACVRMAVAMQRRMHKLQLKWMERGTEKPFRLRIGINTGFCTVGNFGSEDRMDYTMIGHAVNLAARLQSHAEVGSILLAHETYSLVKDEVPAEELDPILVKGIAHPVRIYRVLGVTDDIEAATYRHNGNGLRIEAYLHKLPPEDRTVAIRAVETLLAKLRDAQAPGS